MDATLLPMIQGLITVAGTLGGTWLGTQLSKGKEERQWRRDRCLDAYAEVLTLSGELFEIFSDLEIQRADFGETRKLLWKKLAELASVSNKAALLAPSTVQERIVALIEGCHEMIVKSDPKDLVGDWLHFAPRYKKLGDDLMRAAQVDLGGHVRSR